MSEINLERLALLVIELQTTYDGQAYGSLHEVHTDNKCCLGVACAVAIRNGLHLERELSADGQIYSYDKEFSVLPAAVVDWYGFDRQNPEFSDRPAIDWNDTLHVPFPQIAAEIVKTYPGVAEFLPKRKKGGRKS